MGRPVCVLGWVLVLLLGTGPLAGCSLHLHNPADAKLAKAALDGYGNAKFEDVLPKARKNSSELAKAERQAVVNLTESLLSAEVAQLLTATPIADPPVGWFQLEHEAREVLGPLGVLEADRLKLESTGDALRIRNRFVSVEEQRAGVATQRERLGVFLRRYTGGLTPGRQPTLCDYRPTPEDLSDQIPTDTEANQLPRPPNEPEAKWRYYVGTVVPACQAVRDQEERADPGEFLVRFPEFKALNDKIVELDAEVRADVVEARRLQERLAAATRELADAQAQLAEATVEKQTEKATASVADLQKKVANGTAAFDAIVKESQKLPLASALAKQEILQTLLANVRAIGGGDDAGAHELTKHLLTALKSYPGVAGPLKAAKTPPVNLLLLELTAQRLESQRLDAEVRWKRDRLKLLQAQREAWIVRVRSWIAVVKAVEAVNNAPDPGRLRQKSIAEVHAQDSGEQQRRVAAVVNAYTEARVRYEGPVKGLEFDEVDRLRVLRLDLSEVALTAWHDFIRAPLQELTAYHEGGITSDDLAKVIHALGLAGIAVGVNR